MGIGTVPDSGIQWTHPSVLLLAGGDDPLTVVVERARELVWQAVERGWKGPPFDPFALAELLGLGLVPRDDIPDARIVPRSGGGLSIEFNPARPRARIRYSIAHEIAHTLFPDCGARIRNRARRHEMQADEWQLEMLCNLAASELLMPIGSFVTQLSGQQLSISHLMRLRQEHEVSSEALWLRVIRLTEQPCFMFASSRVSDSEADATYRIDYAVASKTSAVEPAPGTLLPSSDMLASCTGIGFTNHGTEDWGPSIGRVHVECVGIPPFPGRVFPRVVGVGWRTTHVANKLPTIKMVTGDATRPSGAGAKLLAFVVNDKAAIWGGGFAYVVRRKWPEVQESFRRWAVSSRDEFKLGSIHEARVDASTRAVAMVAQHGYGPSPFPRIRYSALATCLKSLARLALESGATVHMPRIGVGEAGGSWHVVSELIQENLCHAGVHVTIYSLPGAAQL